MFRKSLTVIPLLSKLFIKQSVRNSPPIGEDNTDCCGNRVGEVDSENNIHINNYSLVSI